MGIFSTFMKGTDINESLKVFNSTKGAMLIDVRDPKEYGLGHIPGAVNMPLGVIEARSAEIKDKSTPIFLYCVSGGRAGQAASILKSKGFINVTNIGGINSYKGQKEKSTGRAF
ncbi:MAG: rhodanese-like domain-containing protein [Clostridiales bacterium]|nr:rhodanese-like domain-containing protein [Clostridiales bacterium]